MLILVLGEIIFPNQPSHIAPGKLNRTLYLCKSYIDIAFTATKIGKLTKAYIGLN